MQRYRSVGSPSCISTSCDDDDDSDDDGDGDDGGGDDGGGDDYDHVAIEKKKDMKHIRKLHEHMRVDFMINIHTHL